MPLSPVDKPVLLLSLPELTTSSVAHPDTFNPINQILLNNDAALDSALKAVDLKAGQIGKRVDGLEASSAVSVRTALGLDWTYRGNPICFELFDPSYTMIDISPIAVLQGIQDDDSLDVADTAKLKVGDFCVLTDQTQVDAQGALAPVTVLVQIASVLSAQRVRLTANLSRTWGVTAKLARSSFKAVGASLATAVPGDVYLTRAINIGTDIEGGSVVVRRSLNSAVMTLYYRDAYQLSWKAAGWGLRRTGGSIPEGYADFEYVLPMRGEGYLRFDVSGDPVNIQHIVALGSSTGLGGYVNPELRPNKPVNSAPTNGLTGVLECPSLSIAAYSSPVGNAQGAIQFQIAVASTFAQVLYDTGAMPAALSFSVPVGVLAVNKLHYWRARVMDVGGLWSDWSTVFQFTTAASYVYVVTPTITGPSPNSTDVPEQPTLSCSAFNVFGGTDTHNATQWRIRSAAGSYASPVWDSGADSGNKLSVIPPVGKLLAGQTVYYLQCRHFGAARGWSEWSPEVKITTKDSFATVIGIALVVAGGGAGQWQRIDDMGAGKVFDASYFSSNPIYGAIQDVTIDGQAMVKIPAFYVKGGTIATGSYAGKRAWWISDQPLTGYSLHPAFMEAGVPIAQFWVGKYQGSVETSKLMSVADKMPRTSATLATLKGWAAARNVSGVTGFSIWSCHQLSAIQLLALIEFGGADVQSIKGTGLVTGTDYRAVSDAQVITASWRGIMGLWGNIWQIADGLKLDASLRYQIWDKSGNKNFITTGQVAPATGYAVNFSVNSSASHDLGVGFYPASADTQVANGSTSDEFRSAAGGVAYHGGPYPYRYAAGLFCLTLMFPDTHVNDSVGTRLAKV